MVKVTDNGLIFFEWGDLRGSDASEIQ